MALSTESIVQVALRLLNEGGLDQLTTRRLAIELDVQSPALYYHFKDKQQLLGQMTSVILEQCFAAAKADAGDNADWDVWLCAYARASRLTLLRIRDAARVLTSQSPTGQMKSKHIPAVITPLIDAGFSRELATEAGASIAAFMLGWVGNEQNPAINAFLASMLDLDSAFEHGVEALVAGFRVKLAALDKASRTRTGKPSKPRRRTPRPATRARSRVNDH